MFRVKATELTAYDNLFWLHEDLRGKTIQPLQGAYGDDVTLRITKYTKKLDLAGCHQVTGAVLFQALLQFARQNTDLESYLSVEAEVLKIQKNAMSTSDFSDQDWCKKLTLEKLHDVNLQRCWRLDHGALSSWLSVACPNLKLLDISHRPQIEFTILSQISSSCKSLEKVTMSLYFKRLHVKSSARQEHLHLANHSSLRFVDSMPLSVHLTSLTSLSLDGRQNLKDCDLDLVAKCCSNLSAIDLGGCLQLTDKGLAHLLASLSSLTVLEAAYTAFGESSVFALLRDRVAPPQPSDVIYSLETRHDVYAEKCILTALDLEGCSNVDNISLSRLLRKTPFLEYLNLGFMRVDDSTLLSFGGTSLKKLNLRETEVSECSIADILLRNGQLENLNIKGCKRLAVSFGLETVVTAQDNCTSDLQKGFPLKNLAFGWGFTDSTLNTWKSALRCLQSLSLGLGGRISDGHLSALYESSPQLQQLSLTFQIVSDTSLVKLLRNLPTLCSLELHHCLGEVTHAIIGMMPTSLTKLCLERGVAWMTDGDVELLGSRCMGLTNIAFTGGALLTPKSLHVMCEKWRGMTNLVLQECGTITADGGCCLFVCRAIEQLTLRHSGSGLTKDFAERAHVELPLLQELCLDICDSKDGGFNSINAFKRRSLMLLRLTRCTTLRNCFNRYARQHYKDTVFIEWVDNQECDTVINEGL